jgi:hypothetical protein
MTGTRPDRSFLPLTPLSLACRLAKALSQRQWERARTAMVELYISDSAEHTSNWREW